MQHSVTRAGNRGAKHILRWAGVGIFESQPRVEFREVDPGLPADIAQR
jgi:hypothetical protein